VAAYALGNHARLAAGTRSWHKTFYEESTLPRWLLFRLHSTACNLATDTCQWWGSDRFWAWEGVGCCEGTCTHVWNYAHASARLFPEIERIIGEVLAEKAAMTCEVVPENERDALIKRLLEEEIGPALGTHDGGLQLVAIDGDKVVVAMKGACQMCANLQTTVNEFVQKELREKVDENIVVEVGG